MELLKRLYISAQIRMRNFAEEFKGDEKGVSSIIATVILILIVLLLVSVFWKNLQDWFTNKLWNNVTNSTLPTVESK